MYQQIELRTMLAHAISQLPGRHRVIELYYEHGLSTTQIAQLWQIHPSHVSQLHAAAIKRLQRDLEASIHEPTGRRAMQRMRCLVGTAFRLFRLDPLSWTPSFYRNVPCNVPWRHLPLN